MGNWGFPDLAPNLLPSVVSYWRLGRSFKACGAINIRLLASSPHNLLLAPLLFTLLSYASATVAGELPSIEVNGLFGNQAVLTINGQQRILRRGQKSPEGVTLVSSTLAHAVLRFEDMELKLDLSSRVAGGFKAVEKNVISVPADGLGQYRVQLTVNGQRVSALVDTGASVIAISSAQADRMGIDYLAGQQGQVVTANGRATSYFVTLDKVAVGGLVQRNVRAAVVNGFYPEEVLLGMSFLGGLNLTEANGVLSLTQLY